MNKVYKRQLLIYLANHPDFTSNAEIREEWKRLRDELYGAFDIEKRLIEVLYNDEVIFTAVRSKVCEKCIKAQNTIDALIRNGTKDIQGRTYRWKK
ncbi:hypothetical protein [Enterococcus sp.]|uniref:hypothetical protein n=1 Tax=Enterococcus sp. TaxID=35783 RepID=UPI0028980F20|nr:hypothetical protein [Enterococcus sp.]